MASTLLAAERLASVREPVAQVQGDCWGMAGVVDAGYRGAQQSWMRCCKTILPLRLSRVKPETCRVGAPHRWRGAGVER